MEWFQMLILQKRTSSPTQRIFCLCDLTQSLGKLGYLAQRRQNTGLVVSQWLESLGGQRVWSSESKIKTSGGVAENMGTDVGE